jgi:uncharacterized protein
MVLGAFSLRLTRAFAKAAALGVVLALMLGLTGGPAVAQTDQPAHRSYISPFPNGDRYRIVVVGDSLGEGLWGGLYRAFEDDPTLDFIQRSQGAAGFVNTRRYDWNGEIDKILKDGNYQVVVAMFGANDAQTITKDGKPLKFGTEEWREAYGARVETFIKKLHDANVAVYWVGLPVMRSPGQSANAEKLNDVFREKAFVNGAKYVDTWEGFVDEQGRYSAYGPDMTGNVKRLRADDGVHFTLRGNVKLAHFVEKELRKDINLAKAERNIPLAGNEQEQAKVKDRFIAPRPVAPKVTEEQAAADDDTAGDEDGMQESQVGDVSVVRPSLTAQPASADGLTAQQAATTTEPEVITSPLPGGFTSMATISAVTDLTLASSRPRLPLKERPYYRVLIRGEQLEPKSGRADDFAWPPS